jgi:cytochrome c-type biogenesis protein
MEHIGILTAFAGGLLSFLSPCVLPLAPPYLAYLAGTTLDQVTDDEVDDKVARRVKIASLFFVAGLATVFVTLGATASALGQMLAQHKYLLGQIAGGVIVVMGLHFLGLVRIGLLNRQWRADTGGVSNVSLGGAYVIGLAFAFGWTPCIGPQLGAILSLAASEADMVRGTALLGVYALGLGLPFLLVAIFFPRLTGVMGWMKRHMEQIERVMGLLLWTIGLLMLTGGFSSFSYWLLETFPALAMLG